MTTVRRFPLALYADPQLWAFEDTNDPIWVLARHPRNGVIPLYVGHVERLSRDKRAWDCCHPALIEYIRRKCKTEDEQ